MGDDWLWLSNAKDAWGDLSLFVGRPMYGYFRPLNLLWVAIVQKVVGANPYIFSLINVTLHALNVYLLYLVLKRFGAKRLLLLISPIIYGFYFLNAPAIEWISVGHDLWVTTFSLVFLILTLNFCENPSPNRFLLLLAAGLGALGFKESGFVTLGLYFCVLVLTGKNPLSKKYVGYSLILLAIYCTYLVFYFHDHVVDDSKEVALGIGALINLWYFFSYMLFPVARRMVEVVPGDLIFLLQALKYGVTLLTPVLVGLTLWRGSRATRLFLLWAIGFAATAAIFDWGLGLFDLYPGRTISRFMYTPNVGIAVVVGWLISRLVEFSPMRWLRVGYIAVIAALLFLLLNFGATYKMSQLYFARQDMATSLIEDLKKLEPDITDSSILLVEIPDLESTPVLVRTGVHLKAIVNVVLSKKITVEITESTRPPTDFQTPGRDTLHLVWDIEQDKLLKQNF